MKDFVSFNHVMSKIEEIKELKQYENIHKHEADIEAERQKIFKIKEKLDKQEKEENSKADSIKQHLHQLTSNNQHKAQSNPSLTETTLSISHNLSTATKSTSLRIDTTSSRCSRTKISDI